MDDAQLCEYVRVPYVHEGRSAEGWDCWGLIVWLYGHLYGIKLGDFLVDPRQTEIVAETIASNIAGTWSLVDVPEEGDIALFRKARLGCHLAFALDAERFLGTTEAHGTHIQRFDSPFWARFLLGVYRHRDRLR